MRELKLGLGDPAAAGGSKCNALWLPHRPRATVIMFTLLCLSFLASPSVAFGPRRTVENRPLMDTSKPATRGTAVRDWMRVSHG
jgi:hypothetical protein